MRLEGKSAIVTGAGSGIGRAIARRFAHEGARLVLNDVDEERLRNTARELDGDGHELVSGDVSREETAETLARTARERLGGIDVLVNNAGVHFIRDITDTASEEWDMVVGVNLKSMFLCSKHAIPAMLETGGSIINLASISSFVGQEMEGKSTYLYNVTKAGALQLAVSLATRYAEYGIRANALCPGATHTEQIKNESPNRTPEQEQEIWAGAGGATPLGRVGDPSEIAAAALFLASEESSFVTGSPLIVDGGYLAR